jgi:hypothetical protein
VINKPEKYGGLGPSWAVVPQKRIFFLCLINYHAMNAYGEVEVEIQALLTSVLDTGEW